MTTLSRPRRAALCWIIVAGLLLGACGGAEAPAAVDVASAGTAVPAGAAVIAVDTAPALVPVARWGQGEVRVLAVTPDAQTIAVGTTIGVALYDAQTLQPRRYLPTAARVDRLAITADGATLASAQTDGTIVLWGLADGARLHVLDARGPSRDLIEALLRQSSFLSIESLAFSPDGALLAGDTSGDQFRLWEVASGALIAQFDVAESRTTSLAFSPDGSLLAVGGGWQGPGSARGTLQLWDVAQRTVRHTLEGHTNVVQSLSFTPDGAALASADEDGAIRRWQLPDGAPIAERATDRSAALLPGGRYLAYGYREPPDVRELADGRLASQLDLPIAFTEVPLIAAAGTTLVALHPGDLLSRWELTSGKLLGRGRLPDHGIGGAGLVLTADGATALVGMGDGRVLLRRMRDGVITGELRGHDEQVLAVVRSRDGAMAAVGSEDGSVSLWRLADRTLLRRIPVGASWVRGVAFSPDGTLLATLGIEHERTILKLWRVADGQLLWRQDGGAEVGDVVLFAGDGATVIAGFWDGSVRRWRAADGAPLGEIRAAPVLRDRVQAIVLSPDGAQAAFLVALSGLELWDAQAWVRRHSYQGEVGTLESAAFSPDGQLLATGSGIDNVVQAWSAAAGGRPLATLRGHTGSVESVVFAPDQTQIISASDDGTVRLWSLGGPDGHD